LSRLNSLPIQLSMTKHKMVRCLLRDKVL
jgi:hypothetical protein